MSKTSKNAVFPANGATNLQLLIEESYMQMAPRDCGEA
jgi:hypothetical protein